jgi:hypothetical protein
LFAILRDVPKCDEGLSCDRNIMFLHWI